MGRGPEPTYLLAKAILKPWLAAWFRWNIEGIEHIPSDSGAILAFNHIAYLDPFAAAFVVDRAKRRPRFLAKSELFEDKRIAWILRGAKQIPVKRGTAQAPMALDRAVEALRSGEIVVIFPEGTITKDPDLNPAPAKSGTARLAIATGVPVVPAALWGTANVWGKGSRKNWRPRQDICVRVGPPLDLSGHGEDPHGWTAAGEQVMAAIGLLLAGIRPAIPDRRRSRRAA